MRSTSRPLSYFLILPEASQSAEEPTRKRPIDEVPGEHGSLTIAQRLLNLLAQPHQLIRRARRENEAKIDPAILLKLSLRRSQSIRQWSARPIPRKAQQKLSIRIS